MRSVLFRSAMSFVLLGLCMSVSAQEAQQATQVEPQAEAAATAEVQTEPATEATVEVDAKVETPTTAATVANNSIIGAPPAGQGQVVFFRPSKFVGGGVGFKVREATTELGKLRNGSYIVAIVEPGTHQYNVHGEAKDVLTLEVEAGETYYVKFSVGMGIVAGRPNLSPSDQATFDGMARKLKRVQ